MADIFKKLAWYILTPIFPFVRSFVRFMGIQIYKGRQPYHIGWLAPGKTAEGFRQFLQSEGFDIDRIAWIDPGEVVNLRLRENFRYQYHVRLFADGEIRGHHELTPEYEPIAHLRDGDTSERREDFLRLLGDWVTTGKN